MWTFRGRGEILLGQCEAASHTGQTVLKVRELPAGHQVDRSQCADLLQAFVVEEPALACVVVDAKAASRVKIEVYADVLLLEIGERPLRLATERGL